MLSFLTFVFAALPLEPSQDPIVTDRPDFTESSLVVPRNALQIETGLTYEKITRRASNLSGPEALLRYGLADKLELRVGLPNYNRFESPDAEGFDDLYLGAKIQLGSHRGTDFALIPAVFIPAGRRGIRSESVTPELKVTYARDIGAYALSGMVHVASVEEEGERSTPFQLTNSLGIPVKERIGMFLEHILGAQDGERPAHILHSGFTYQPRPDRQFDLHYGFGLTPNAPDFFIGAGFSIRF